MPSKQKATIENKNVVKKRETEKEYIRVKFIIPVFSNGIIYQRNTVYNITLQEAEKYKGDYILC